ncbi:hypothetical protein BVRB_2g047920 [Beta vulgaris subsp. vulgaris]|uniref:Uncharacterized protein n=1 Tax=Beta vulgaris subsp. vulgaris TaxID=3555 RepID=A0A0J8E7L8_BETVV|nr:hypothetical protein BVRB_2g047920 [Beta vulgaris subsp. vulgaris]
MKSFSHKNNNFQMMSCFLILSLVMMSGIVDAAGFGSIGKFLEGIPKFFQNKNPANFMKKANELAERGDLKKYCPFLEQKLIQYQSMANSPRYQKFKNFTENLCKKE